MLSLASQIKTLEWGLNTVITMSSNDKGSAKTNIVLIGMPGSGKSTIGRALSRRMGLGFIDCDEYIEREEGQTLQQIIDSEGDEGFKRVEEARILELDLENHVIAPGGSFVYYPKAVKHLKKSSIFVLLNMPFDEIEDRLNSASTRGIVGLKTKTLHRLFSERLPLYLKYADITIDCSGKSEDAIVEEIHRRLAGKPKS